MFTWKKTEKTGLQRVIDALELHLEDLDPSDPNYAKLVDKLSQLYTMKKGDSPLRVSPDVLVQAGAGIVAVLLVLHYEKLGVVTSKAFSFVKFR